MENCIFCKIIKGQLPSNKVYEDENILAFMDIQPINQGHTLVIPKIHEQLITELDNEIVKKLMLVGNKVNKAIRKSEIKCQGVNFFLADGKAAGQEVFHVHLHIIPRFAQDGFGFVYPENHKNKPDAQELENTAKDISKNLN